MYVTTMRGNKLLIYQGHRYIKNNAHGIRIYWKCTRWHTGCKARAITNIGEDSCVLKNAHNHESKSEVN